MKIRSKIRHRFRDGFALEKGVMEFPEPVPAETMAMLEKLRRRRFVVFVEDEVDGAGEPSCDVGPPSRDDASGPPEPTGPACHGLEGPTDAEVASGVDTYGEPGELKAVLRDGHLVVDTSPAEQGDAPEPESESEPAETDSERATAPELHDDDATADGSSDEDVGDAEPSEEDEIVDRVDQTELVLDTSAPAEETKAERRKRRKAEKQ